jgi:hypothetical protein
MSAVIRYSFEFLNKNKSNDMLDLSIIKKLNPVKEFQRSNNKDFLCRVPEFMDKDIIKRKLSKNLNKLSESNFENIKNNIFGMLIKDDIKYFLLEELFNNAIKQFIYLDLYLRIFKDLIKDKDYGEELKSNYKDILEKKIDSMINKIEDVNPDTDYYKFGKTLENKEILKNIYVFIAKTYKEKLYLINNKQLYGLIKNLIEIK